MNIELLEKIVKHIEDSPNQFDMDIFMDGEEEDGRGFDCRTTACIAGWAILLSEKDCPYRISKAEILLGLDAIQADKLFSSNKWPEPYRTLYSSCRCKEDELYKETWTVNREESTKVAVSYLRDLIVGIITL